MLAHAFAHPYIYIYIYIYMCVYLYMYLLSFSLFALQGNVAALQQEIKDTKRMHSKELEEARAEVQGEVTGLQQEVEDGARLHSKARASQNELEMQLQGAQCTISALGKVRTCVRLLIRVLACL